MNLSGGATISYSNLSMQTHELIIDRTDNEHCEAVIVERAQR